MPVMSLNKLQDTTLWKHLESGFTGNDANIAKTLATNLIDICQDASDRMRGFSSIHPQYTLHDEVHLLRVTEIMSKIIPREVRAHLNPIEIALLILSAYFHDQGMILEANEFSELEHNKDFKKFRDDWEVEHPNFIDLKQRLTDRSLRE